MNEYEKNNISVIDFKSGLLSCVDDASVRVMPEFNCKDTKVNLAKKRDFFRYIAIIY